MDFLASAQNKFPALGTLASTFSLSRIASTSSSLFGSVLSSFNHRRGNRDDDEDSDEEEDEDVKPKFVFKDVDALDVGRRRRKSLTGKSNKYKFGNDPLSREFDEASAALTSQLSDAAKPSKSKSSALLKKKTSAKSLKSNKDSTSKISKNKLKKGEESASFSRFGSARNSMFVWNSLPLNSRGKEAREKSRAEESAKKNGKRASLKKEAAATDKKKSK
jgi:hypothetical protein